MTNTILTDTSCNRLTSLQVQKPQAAFTLKSAAHFTVQQLTDIYNQTRVDYLVPMPMNVAKMKEYIQVYDVDLAQSAVAVSGSTPLGLGLLGPARRYGLDHASGRNAAGPSKRHWPRADE